MVERAFDAARGAYARAHLIAGAWAAAIGIAIIWLAGLLHRTTDATWLVGGTLAITLGVLGWRGGAMRRGALAGVLAGLPPLLAPVIVAVMSHGMLRCADCPAMPSLACTMTCFGTAAAVGLVVGHRASRDLWPRRFAGAALSTAILTGALGCGTTGLGGAVGIVIGLVAGSVAGLLVAQRPA